MKLLVCPKPIHGESLSSYLQRISKLNFVGSYDFWRLLIQNGTHYPQSSLSASLDLCPYCFIELHKLASMLDITGESLENMTFIPLYKKLGIDKLVVHHSRVLSNIIERHRKYCPKCLKENRYYKLIWQVKEVRYCENHCLELISRCPCCDKQIPILPSSSHISFCPYCNFDLAKFEGRKITFSNDMSRIYEDWSYLIDSSKTGLEPLQRLTNKQGLAVRILYLSSILPANTLSEAENSTLKSVLQIARDSKESQTFIHLSTILSIARKAHISLESFFTMPVSEEYVKSLFMKKELLSKTYSCIAPWCSSYLIPGSLKHTATSKKVLKNGSAYNYYMYCEKCGIEYRLSNRELSERSDFISFAWNILKDKLNSKQPTLRELSLSSNTTVDKVRRAIIFLSANKLVSSTYIPIELPENHKRELLDKLKSLIVSGFYGKKIRKELKMKYSDFLYYWFHPEVIIAYINRKKPVVRSTQRTTLNVQYFKNILEYLYQNNIPITINQVSKSLNVCPETLRLWGCLDLIKKAKHIQREKILQQKKEAYLAQAKVYIANAINTNHQVRSEELYKYIGSPRTVIVRNFPDVTAYISQLMSQFQKS